MKDIKEMSMWDALENIADMMIEEGWTAEYIGTAEETLRHIKSDLFEVERFDAASDLAKAAGDSAWILSKVEMIVAERGFNHQADDSRLRDLAWDIEEMWTGCGIARIDEGHKKFTSWVDYYEFTDECLRYGLCEIEAFVNWEEDEYDIDGILEEVTFVDPMTGDRYWEPEFVDDEDALFEVCMRYHKDDDEEDDDEDVEQEESEHMDDIMAEIATSRRPWQRDTISEEWNGNGFDRLIIDISYDPHIDENGAAWRYKVHPDYDLEDRFDGAGYAEALSEKLEQDYAATDGDKIATAIAMARISEICHDYEDIKAGRPSAPSKRQMADIWAEAMGLELIEDVQTGPWAEELWAEGYLAKYRILVLYNSNFNGEEV